MNTAHQITRKYNSQMLVRNGERVDLHAVCEPTLLFRDGDVVSAHLPLLHAAILSERPILNQHKRV